VTPTAADVFLVTNAAAIIDGEADALRSCSTRPDGTWPDPQDKLLYDQWKQKAAGLNRLAERMRAG